MSETPPFEDFGAPSSLGSHVFLVDIPASRNESVLVIESYGYRGGDRGIPEKETRVQLERSKWSQMADVCRGNFNERLKAKRIPTGRWHTGINKLDKLLGKELCVLAWACETASLDKLPIICQRWVSLRPEERWWLFRMTVAEGGLAQDRDRGWRKALYEALSDGKIDEKRARRPRPDEAEELSLFGGSVEERNHA